MADIRAYPVGNRQQPRPLRHEGRFRRQGPAGGKGLGPGGPRNPGESLRILTSVEAVVLDRGFSRICNLNGPPVMRHHGRDISLGRGPGPLLQRHGNVPQGVRGHTQGAQKDAAPRFQMTDPWPRLFRDLELKTRREFSDIVQIGQDA